MRIVKSGRNHKSKNTSNSIDGTIYVGTSDGGKIIAINPNGTEKWRKHHMRYLVEITRTCVH